MVACGNLLFPAQNCGVCISFLLDVCARLVACAPQIRVLNLLMHPAVVRFVGSFETETSIYIALEYMASGDLQQVEHVTKTRQRTHTHILTLRSTPYTLHPTPCTLHPAPYTLHPTPPGVSSEGIPPHPNPKPYNFTPPPGSRSKRLSARPNPKPHNLTPPPGSRSKRLPVRQGIPLHHG
jgi:hypothetical protein